MASTVPYPAPAPWSGERRANWVGRHPLTAFLALAFGLGVPVLLIAVLQDVTPIGLLWLVFVALFGSSVLVTWLTDGGAGVRRLLARMVKWRFSPWRWGIILFAVPVLTVALAAVSGTLSNPDRGWAAEVAWYLFNTLIFGALSLNLWEEAAWAGFAQSRWMARHGLLVASLITAVFFAAIHVPLQFEGDPSAGRVVASIGLVLLTALFARYLIGMHMLATGGSILAVGIQHASWNAAQKLEAVDGGDWSWQMVAAVAMLTVILAIWHRLDDRRRGSVGTDHERAAAAGWVAPSPAKETGARA